MHQLHRSGAATSLTERRGQRALQLVTKQSAEIDAGSLAMLTHDQPKPTPEPTQTYT